MGWRQRWPQSAAQEERAERVWNSSYGVGAPRGILNLVWGLVATMLSVVLTAICAIAVAIAATMGKQHAVTVITRAWARGIIGVCGVKVQIEGLENLTGLKS